MKLSELAKKLGLDPAKITDIDLANAIDAVVTRAAAADALMPILDRWKGKVTTPALAIEMANDMAGAAYMSNPKLDAREITCGPEKALITSLQGQLNGMGTSLVKANEATTAAKGETATAVARALKAESDLTLVNEELTKVKGEKAGVETNLANIKTGIAKATVSAALRTNQILTSEKTTVETTLANSADIATDVVKILTAAPKLHTTSIVAKGRKEKALNADPNSCTNQFRNLVNEKVEKGTAYDVAWQEVKKTQPNLWAGMEVEKPQPK